MRPLILVSNDDSYTAKGVHVLIDRLVKFGDVVAVCPQYPRRYDAARFLGLPRQ